MSKLKDMLIRHEGCVLKPYVDSVGKYTIGIGRNLEDVGISKAEAMVLLDNDIVRAVQAVRAVYPWYEVLNEPRKDVIVSMVFNMGLVGFSKFRKTIEFLERGDYKSAAEEMLSSKWAKQVGVRAKELARIMESGQYLET